MIEIQNMLEISFIHVLDIIEFVY